MPKMNYEKTNTKDTILVLFQKVNQEEKKIYLGYLNNNSCMVYAHLI